MNNPGRFKGSDESEGRIEEPSKILCAACRSVVEEIRLSEGRAAAIAAAARMEPLCDRKCHCGRPIRCDAESCGNHLDL